MSLPLPLSPRSEWERALRARCLQRRRLLHDGKHLRREALRPWCW